MTEGSKITRCHAHISASVVISRLRGKASVHLQILAAIWLGDKTMRLRICPVRELSVRRREQAKCMGFVSADRVENLVRTIRPGVVRAVVTSIGEGWISRWRDRERERRLYSHISRVVPVLFTQDRLVTCGTPFRRRRKAPFLESQAKYTFGRVDIGSGAKTMARGIARVLAAGRTIATRATTR
jgi:hypothetical protein